MKHIQLFEQFINEDKMEVFLNTMIKNPKSGRAVKVSSLINDKENPLYKKLQQKKAEIEGGSGDSDNAEMKEAKEELKGFQKEYAELADDMKVLRSEIADHKNDIKDSDDEEMADMAKSELEDKEGQLEEKQAELGRISDEIAEVKDWIKNPS